MTTNTTCFGIRQTFQDWDGLCQQTHLIQILCHVPGISGRLGDAAHDSRQAAGGSEVYCSGCYNTRVTAIPGEEEF